MRVIIAGSRNFNNYDFLKQAISQINIDITEVVCGEARGADTLGRRFAIENYIPIKSFPADWNRYGRAAGSIRNHQMGDYADYLIAFWDERSTGTKDMIIYMQQIGKHGTIVRYKNLI